MNNDFSDIDEKNCEELGLQGYCFFACLALRELHPESEIWRLTGDSEYSHVILKVNAKTLDIKGFRNVEEMKLDCGGGGSVAERADLTEAVKYFGNGFTEKAERDYVMQKFRRYIKENAVKYT